MSDDGNDYDVGYGKPPKRTQFKKGQSGNPKGRPKGAKGFTASLKRELESTVTIQEGGRRLKVSKAEAAAKRFVAKALNGDMPALKQIAQFDADLQDKLETEAARSLDAVQPDKTDEDVLSHFKEKLLAQAFVRDELAETGEVTEPDEAEGPEKQNDPREMKEPVYAEDVEDE